jgi:hypothetical protein
MAKKASKSKKSAAKKTAKKKTGRTFDPFGPGHRVFKKKSGG